MISGRSLETSEGRIPEGEGSAGGLSIMCPTVRRGFSRRRPNDPTTSNQAPCVREQLHGGIEQCLRRMHPLRPAETLGEDSRGIHREANPPSWKPQSGPNRSRESRQSDCKAPADPVKAFCPSLHSV